MEITKDHTHAKETLASKLRNLLSPMYALTSMVAAIENIKPVDKPELIRLSIEQAKSAHKKDAEIELVLNKIDAMVDKNQELRTLLLQIDLVATARPNIEDYVPSRLPLELLKKVEQALKS